MGTGGGVGIDAERWRDAFLAADYLPDAVADLLGPIAHRALARDETVPAEMVSDEAPGAGRSACWRCMAEVMPEVKLCAGSGAEGWTEGCAED